MFRAEKEKQIAVDIGMSRGRIVELAKKYFMP
jgi:hypothetical protein